MGRASESSGEPGADAPGTGRVSRRPRPGEADERLLGVGVGQGGERDGMRPSELVENAALEPTEAFDQLTERGAEADDLPFRPGQRRPYVHLTGIDPDADRLQGHLVLRVVDPRSLGYGGREVRAAGDDAGRARGRRRRRRRRRQARVRGPASPASAVPAHPRWPLQLMRSFRWAVGRWCPPETEGRFSPVPAESAPFPARG